MSNIALYGMNNGRLGKEKRRRFQEPFKGLQKDVNDKLGRKTVDSRSASQSWRRHKLLKAVVKL